MDVDAASSSFASSSYASSSRASSSFVSASRASSGYSVSSARSYSVSSVPSSVQDNPSGYTRSVAEAVTEQHGHCPDHKRQFEQSVIGGAKYRRNNDDDDEDDGLERSVLEKSILKVGKGSMIAPSLSAKQAIELARRYQTAEMKYKAKTNGTFVAEERRAAAPQQERRKPPPPPPPRRESPEEAPYRSSPRDNEFEFSSPQNEGCCCTIS